MRDLLNVSGFREYEGDLLLNLRSVIDNKPESLTVEQYAGVTLASLAATGRSDLVVRAKDIVDLKYGSYLSDAALGAASLMNQINIYRSARSSLSSLSQSKMDLKTAFKKLHRVSAVDFDLFSLAVCIMNNSSVCLIEQEESLIKRGVSSEVINDVLRIVSVLSAYTKRIG